MPQLVSATDQSTRVGIKAHQQLGRQSGPFIGHLAETVFPMHER